jgi:hypothetical protein
MPSGWQSPQEGRLPVNLYYLIAVLAAALHFCASFGNWLEMLASILDLWLLFGFRRD